MKHPFLWLVTGGLTRIRVYKAGGGVGRSRLIMTKKTPFSRADYNKRRRIKHTAEEREMKAYLEHLFRRKYSWRVIKEYVRIVSWGQDGLSADNPIIVD